MMDEERDFSALKIILSGAPEGCGLRDIKKEVLKTLKTNQPVVTKVKKCKTQFGDIIPGKFEVELVSREGL